MTLHLADGLLGVTDSIKKYMIFEMSFSVKILRKRLWLTVP